MADQPTVIDTSFNIKNDLTTATESLDELFPKCKVKSASKAASKLLNDDRTTFFRNNGNVVDLLMSPNNNTSVIPCYDKTDCRIMYQEGDEDLLGLDSPVHRKDSSSESGGSGGSCGEELQQPEMKWVEAGAKEVFSHSRARAGRKRSGDDWGKKVKRVDADAAVRRPVKVYKETVFASEIKTLENPYNPPTGPDLTCVDTVGSAYYSGPPENVQGVSACGTNLSTDVETLSGSTVKNLADSLLMMSASDTKLVDADNGNTSDESTSSSHSSQTENDAKGSRMLGLAPGSGSDSLSPSSSPVARVIGEFLEFCLLVAFCAKYRCKSQSSPCRIFGSTNNRTKWDSLAFLFDKNVKSWKDMEEVNMNLWWIFWKCFVVVWNHGKQVKSSCSLRKPNSHATSRPEGRGPKAWRRVLSIHICSLWMVDIRFVSFHLVSS